MIMKDSMLVKVSHIRTASNKPKAVPVQPRIPILT